MERVPVERLPDISAQLDDVLARLVELTEAVRSNRAQVIEVKRQADVQRRQNLAVAAVVLIVGVLALLGWWQNTQRADDNAATQSEFVQQRADSRLGSCNQDNVRIKQHNDLVDALEGIFDQIDAGTTTDAGHALIASARTTVEGARVAIRDCSPAGIAAYTTPTTTPTPLEPSS